MKLRFGRKIRYFGKDSVVIQAERLSDQAREVMDYLEQFSVVNQVVIPNKTDDHLAMVKIDDIILAEIDKNVLNDLYRKQYLYDERETLTTSHIASIVGFLQISRHAVMKRPFGVPIR